MSLTVLKEAMLSRLADIPAIKTAIEQDEQDRQAKRKQLLADLAALDKSEAEQAVALDRRIESLKPRRDKSHEAFTKLDRELRAAVCEQSLLSANTETRRGALQAELRRLAPACIRQLLDRCSDEFQRVRNVSICRNEHLAYNAISDKKGRVVTSSSYPSKCARLEAVRALRQTVEEWQYTFTGSEEEMLAEFNRLWSELPDENKLVMEA